MSRFKETEYNRLDVDQREMYHKILDEKYKIWEEGNNKAGKMIPKYFVSMIFSIFFLHLPAPFDFFALIPALLLMIFAGKMISIMIRIKKNLKTWENKMKLFKVLHGMEKGLTKK